jgi:maleylacetoacetate isomerase
MNNFVLYNYYRSSTSYRTRSLLYYKNINFEYVPVHLMNNGGEQHTTNYKKMNPMSEVPTLQHGEKSIGQTLAIFEYLDAIVPNPSVFPQDPFLRAKTIQICETISCALHPFSNLKVLAYLSGNLKLTDSQKNQWIQDWMTRGLTGLDQMVEQNNAKFSVTDTFTAADIFIMSQFFVADRYKVSTNQFASLNRIKKQCEGIECFKKAHPYRQPDTPEELRID